MKKILPYFFVALLVFGCTSPEKKEFQKSFSVLVTNPLAESRSNSMVFLSLNEIQKSAEDFNSKAFVVSDEENEIPSQFNNNDKEQKGIVFVLKSLQPNESKSLVISYNPTGEVIRNYPKLTQAELSHKVNGSWKEREYMGGEFKNVNSLRVPSEHKDHSWFIRYEGPGWESDKVGYRFYLDQRNAIDVFGKTVTEPVLQKVGLDGFDSYHEIQDWGMDVMKVGTTLGLGSIGMLVDGKAQRVELTDSLYSEVTENGVAYSSILTNYYGWKTKLDTLDLNVTLSIHAGTRLTHQLINLSHDAELVTGLVKDDKGKLVTTAPTDTSYGYMATFGQQSLNNDKLGIAIFFSPQSFISFAEDGQSHIVRLRSDGNKLDYYFSAAWELEPNGIKTEEEFINYLNVVAKELAQPVTVQFQ